MDTAKIYKDVNCDDCTILQMVQREPHWAANRIQEGEKATAALTAANEEAKGLREALERVNKEYIADNGPTLCDCQPEPYNQPSYCAICQLRAALAASQSLKGRG